MTIWYAENHDQLGTGIEDDPWGLPGLVQNGAPGPAFSALASGDQLWLGGGVYPLLGDAVANVSYNKALFCPAAEGCTIRSAPLQVASLRRVGGWRPLIGTYRPGFYAHGTRFLGLELVEG